VIGKILTHWGLQARAPLARLPVARRFNLHTILNLGESAHRLQRASMVVR
jgi:hypothetical protein